MPSHARPAGTLVRLELRAHTHFWYALSKSRACWDLEQGDSTWGLSFLVPILERLCPRQDEAERW